MKNIIFKNKKNKILLYREKKEERIKNTRINNEKEREKKIFYDLKI